MSDITPLITELKLEPLLSKGELVPDGWWQPPQPKRVFFLRRHWLFILTVAVPVALTGFYYFVIAANQYVSETRFVVRSSGQGEMGNLASLMAGQKMSRASDETYAVGDYMISRDALSALIQQNHLRDVFARPQADFLTRFPNALSKASDEEFYRHYQRFVSVENDPESGISTLSVSAFTPEDARDIAIALITSGENLINRLNHRAYEDALRFAEQVVEEQKVNLANIEQELTQFRNDAKLVDPMKEVTITFAGIGQMTAELMELQAEYAQKSAITSNAPSLTAMRQKIAAYQEEIAKQRALVAGNSSSMASKLASYERLILSRELAAKELEGSVIHLTSARQDVEQQRLYLDTIVQPNIADQPRYPRRFFLHVDHHWHLPVCILDFTSFHWRRNGTSGVSFRSIQSRMPERPRQDLGIVSTETRTISVSDIVKDYHTPMGMRRVLDKVSFDIHVGEKIAVLGKNGSGKSTLVKLIGGVEPPTSGQIQRRMFMSWPIGFGGGFDATMSGIDNIRFIARIYNVPMKETIAFVDDFAELGKQLLMPVKTYSSGMRARLAFALTLAIDFECFLIDEVIAVGDARFHQKCYDALFVRRKNCSMILVSHDLGIIRDYCSSALVLKAGRGKVFDDLDLAIDIYHTL